MTAKTEKTTRRKFLAGTAAVAAGAVAAPSVVKAQGPTNMRWQSTWPSKDIFHEYAHDYAKKVNDMTGGDLKIEVLPAGAVVPAFQLLDAVSKGVLDGGHGVLVYHYGKQNALALWGSGPAMPWTPTCCSPGTSTAAARNCSRSSTPRSAPTSCRSRTADADAAARLVQEADHQGRGLQGLKFRTVGISIDVFSGMGAAVNALPGGEIVAAMDRGLLDAAEFNNATSDRILGFADVSKV
jgi:TRAP-type mannitol/chloroaromatic compound transport system substrate-binding protein